MGTRYEDVISRLSRERAMTVASIDTPAPDRAAAANRAARDTGVPAETADRNLERLQRMNEARRMERLIDRNPELARPLGDPRVTAVARDDADGIARVARAFDPEEWARKHGTLKAAPDAERTLWGGVKGVWRSLMGSGAQVESNLLLMMSDWIGGTPSFVNSPTNDRVTTETQLRRIAREEARIDAARPQYKSVAARGVYGGFESAARMAPGIAASIATRNPYPALIAAGVGSGVPAYGKYRNRGGTREEALLGGSLEGGIEVVTEKLPMGYLVENFGRVGFNKFLREYMGRELPSEQLATFAQDAVDTAIANPDKTWGDYWKERPNAQLETAIATLTMSAIGASASALVDRSTRDAVRAEADAEFLDELAGQAAQSKTRQRDPEAFAALVGALRGEAGDSVFVPGEVVREYLQSDTLHDREFWDEYRDQVDEAVATGGDVVLPVDRAVAHLSGTKAWETLKDDMRLSPGGMSLREAAEFDDAYSGTIEAGAQEATQRIEADRVAAEPRQRLFDDAYAKLTNAGFTPDAARLQAELIAQRYATRAARLGTDLTGDEFQTTAINQVMPEGLAPLRSADNVDMVIAALRRSRDPNAGTKRQSLLEFIAARGGLIDTGGDLAAMGADRWHRDKRFRKRLLREGSGDADMLGDSASAQYGLDAALEAAIEAGYFPDLNFTRDAAGEFSAADAPDNRVLLQAIDDELRGQPTYAEDVVPEAMRAVADDLARALDQAGIDPETADDNTIRSFLQRFGDATAGDRQFEQSASDGSWARNVDRIIRGEKPGRLVRIGPTPEPLRKAGLPAGDLYMTAAKLARARREHPEVSLDILRALPALLRDPAAAFPSDRDDGSIVVAVEAQDADGNPVVVPMIASAEGTNIVLSVYGKSEGAAWIERRLARAKREGSPYFEKAGSADAVPKSDPVSEETSSSSSAPIAAEGSAKPNRKILSLRPGVKRQLEQSYADGPRGRVTFAAGRATIDLFEKRDLSTFIHETGHVWLEELKADALAATETEGAEAARQTFADWETVKAWFARNGHAVAEDGTIPVDAHELWARGVERYLMEGKAPTSALRRAFDSFKSWLLTIYQVVDNLRSPITDDIRDVMDRLLATDAEISAARSEQGIGLLFADAQAAGMTEAEYRAYSATAEEARTEARDALLYKTMASVRAKRTKEYKEQRAGVREDIAAQVDSRREFRALAMVRGEMRLDRDAITAAYGADALDLLPAGVPPVYRENGASPDAVAERVGYQTGDEMVRALMGIEARRKAMRAAEDKRTVRNSIIDEETDAVMADRYGDPLADGTIEREARELIHSDMQGDVIAAELRALSRMRPARSAPSQAPTPYQTARRWAERKVAEGEVREYSSRGAIARYQRTARKAAREAEQAIIAGDIDKAFRAKQVQLLNNALISEATKAADAIESAVARMTKVAKRRTLKSVDQDYLEQAQSLLEAVELRERSQVSIARQGAFEEWARAREAEGHDVIVPPSFEASLGTTHYSRLSVERLLGLDQAVSQIMHLGRLKQTLIDGKERREFEAIVGEARAAAGNLPPRPPSDLMDPSFGDRLRSRVSSIDAALLKVETIFDWLDGGNSEGVFNRIAFKPIAEAQSRQTEMLDRYRKELTDHLKAIPRETVKRWADKVQAPELLNRETGNPFVLTRDQLVSVALNMGNAGNIQRLTDGYGWTEDGVRAVLDRELTEAEWTYVQAVWDTLDSLWPDISAMERRINGVEPDKVEAQPVETRFGTLKGGYYPAIYDPSRSVEAEANAARDSASLFENIYTRATTRASSTKDRAAKVSRPIHLSLGVMQQHVAEVIHDVTHREAVMNADRFLHDKRVMRAVDEALGPELRKQFRPWLQHIANEFAAERTGAAGVEGFIKKMRTNTTIVGMGFRVSTIMMQVAGYSNSFERVGARWVGEAIARTIRNPIEVGNFVLERSNEVRERLGNLDRDIRDTIRLAQRGTNPLTEAKRFAFIGIGYMDRAVVIPTWLGAYNKALARGLNEDAAIYEADKAVRQSQGAGAAKDLAAIQRGTGRAGEALKLLTMFYSYMSAVWQRQRTLGRDVATAVRERNVAMTPELLARAWWLLVVPPVLAEILAGRGPEEDEDWATWSMQKMLLQMVGPIPVVRDIAGALDSGFGYRFTPAAGGLETAVRLVRDGERIVEGEPTKRATRNALEVTGYATGLVPGQVAAATQFLVDVGYGEQDPETIGEWWEGLTKGKIKEE